MTPQDRLAPEMRAVLDRLLAEDGPVPDPTTLPPDEGRALSEASNRRWNSGEPAMARVFSRILLVQRVIDQTPSLDTRIPSAASMS